MQLGGSACIRPIFCEWRRARNAMHLNKRIESDLRIPTKRCGGYGMVVKATKGARWMPRHWGPMKDAA